MNIQEAAKYLSEKLRRPYSAKSLANRISEGQGPRRIVRFGKPIFIAADLDAWVEANTRVVKAFSK